MQRKKVYTVLAVLLILTGILFTLILVKQKQSSQSNAAAADKLETENGVLAGNATKQTDTNSSGGNYVALGINTSNTPTPTVTSSARGTIGASIPPVKRFFQQKTARL